MKTRCLGNTLVSQSNIVLLNSIVLAFEHQNFHQINNNHQKCANSTPMIKLRNNSRPNKLIPEVRSPAERGIVITNVVIRLDSFSETIVPPVRYSVDHSYTC
jgi:hypothetical protein